MSFDSKKPQLETNDKKRIPTAEELARKSTPFNGDLEAFEEEVKKTTTKIEQNGVIRDILDSDYRSEN